MNKKKEIRIIKVGGGVGGVRKIFFLMMKFRSRMFSLYQIKVKIKFTL